MTVASDATPTMGRLWDPTASIYQPAPPATLPSVVHAVTVEARTRVYWPPPDGEVIIEGLPRGVIVDVAGRQIIDVDDGNITLISDLDSPDPTGYAAGLILARELTTGSVEHAVALSGPWTPDTRLTVTHADLDPTVPLSQILTPALLQYGAIVVGTADDVSIEIEMPASAPAWRDNLGPAYRLHGLIHSGLRLGAITVAM